MHHRRARNFRRIAVRLEQHCPRTQTAGLITPSHPWRRVARASSMALPTAARHAFADQRRDRRGARSRHRADRSHYEPVAARRSAFAGQGRLARPDGGGPQSGRAKVWAARWRSSRRRGSKTSLPASGRERPKLRRRMLRPRDLYLRPHTSLPNANRHTGTSSQTTRKVDVVTLRRPAPNRRSGRRIQTNSKWRGARLPAGQRSARSPLAEWGRECRS